MFMLIVLVIGLYLVAILPRIPILTLVGFAWAGFMLIVYAFFFIEFLINQLYDWILWNKFVKSPPETLTIGELLVVAAKFRYAFTSVRAVRFARTNSSLAFGPEDESLLSIVIEIIEKCVMKKNASRTERCKMLIGKIESEQIRAWLQSLSSPPSPIVSSRVKTAKHNLLDEMCILLEQAKTNTGIE